MRQATPPPEPRGPRAPGAWRGPRQEPRGSQAHSTPIGWPRRHANKATSLPEAAERHLLFLARGRRDGRGAGVPPRRRRTRRCCDGGGTRRSSRPAVGTTGQAPRRLRPSPRPTRRPLVGPPRRPPALSAALSPTVACRAVATSVPSESPDIRVRGSGPPPRPLAGHVGVGPFWGGGRAGTGDGEDGGEDRAGNGGTRGVRAPGTEAGDGWGEGAGQGRDAGRGERERLRAKGGWEWTLLPGGAGRLGGSGQGAPLRRLGNRAEALRISPLWRLAGCRQGKSVATSEAQFSSEGGADLWHCRGQIPASSSMILRQDTVTDTQLLYVEFNFAPAILEGLK